MTGAHLGFDVGGTASRWVACNGAGQVMGRGSVTGATAHVFNPAERQRLVAALDQLAQALGHAGLTAISLTGGMTGFGANAAKDIRALASAALGLAPEAVLVTDDIIMAYAAHFQPGEGHLISAGTGSIGLHVTSAGDIVRVGGRGILIDDGGSGSWIALRALDRLYRLLDMSGSFDGADILAGEIFAFIGGVSWHDVRQFIYAGDRGRIGTLSLAIARAAEQGDATALSILREAGVQLAQLATALQTRAGHLPIAVIGGVLQLHPVIAEELARRLPDQQVTQPTIDSALAAARLHASDAGTRWRSLLGKHLLPT